MSDMREPIFEQYTFGKVALRKLGNVPTYPNSYFRLYCAGWTGESGERAVMKVSGAQFREAKRGPRKGQLCMMMAGTTVSVYVTAKEMEEFEKSAQRSVGI